MNENNYNSQADERFRRSMGYTDGYGSENAQQTTQFRAQTQNHEQNVESSGRFERSLGYTDQPNTGAMQFQAQSCAQQTVVEDERMQRSMGYTDAWEHMSFGRNSQVSSDFQDAVPQQNSNEYPQSYGSYREKNDVNLQKAEIPGLVSEQKEEGISTVNMKRRLLKKIVRIFFSLIRLLCYTSPLTVMVMYSHPLAIISKETHERLLIASVIILPMVTVCSFIFDLITYNIKTTGRVLSYKGKTKLQGSGDGVTTGKVYVSRVEHTYEGKNYLSEVTLDREPQIGQTVQLRADPKDICDAREPLKLHVCIFRTLAETIYLAVMVYVIFGWEAGKITNWNNGD